jgi:RNA polymerase sigma-70 factor (ECF subfamily)
MDLASGDEFGSADDRRAISDAIATLSPDHQVVVALRYYLDLTADQIAARIGIPVGTVQSRLHYALRQLRVVLDSAESKGIAR